MPMTKRAAALAALLAILAAAAIAATSTGWILNPGARNARVCDAQWLLSGHNVFHVRTYKHTIEGAPASCLYGPRTVTATSRMKWELGYPTKDINGRFGSDLRGLLVGDKKLPPLYAVRRAARHPYLNLKVSYPLKNRASICGQPGVGTHSFYASPNNWQSDDAVDFCVAEGTPILAVRAGTICFKLGALHPGSTGRFGGIRFYLCADDGNQWYYQHAKAIAPGIRLGSKVKAGQVIAYVGVANIAHLHLACRTGCHSFTSFAAKLGIRL